MIALLADQNFNERIAAGLLLREPELDLIYARDVGLASAQDPAVLEWAAKQGRILITHDRRTVPSFAHARVTAGQPMPGVFLVSDEMPIGQAIEQILLAAHCLSSEECRDIVKYFPM